MVIASKDPSNKNKMHALQPQEPLGADGYVVQSHRLVPPELPSRYSCRLTLHMFACLSIYVFVFLWKFLLQNCRAIMGHYRGFDMKESYRQPFWDASQDIQLFLTMDLPSARCQSEKCHSCRLGGYFVFSSFFSLERKVDLVAEMVGLCFVEPSHRTFTVSKHQTIFMRCEKNIYDTF